MVFIFASLVELAAIGFQMRNEGRTTFKLKDLHRKKKVLILSVGKKYSNLNSCQIKSSKFLQRIFWNFENIMPDYGIAI